jgi:hypothetical protein
MTRDSNESASPPRNFTITTAERIHAMAIGPPAWSRRLKRLEDLSALVVKLARAGRMVEAEARLKDIHELVDAHNRYYPTEANLPFHPLTSQQLDGGGPWKPMPLPTIESLLAAAEPE